MDEEGKCLALGFNILHSTLNKKGVRIEIQPRFKIQYPMKNQCNVI
jgi:hypothetical protein